MIPGATVSAVHQPSGTTYEGVSQADGRFFIPGMRVGGPYKVTATLSGFTTEVKDNVSLNLGVAQEVPFALKVASIAETITVVGTSDPVFSSSRTGAATAVTREELATLPTISGRISDITRLTPQAGGNGSFAGQDNRAEQHDGGRLVLQQLVRPRRTTGGIGDRTGVAPISLEAIEQVQVSVAPFDVRQGNFTGAGVNTVTRSGTNQITALGLPPHAQRRRTSAPKRAGLTVNPGIVHVPQHRRAGPAARSSRTGCSRSATTRTQSDKRPLHDVQRRIRAASRSAATSPACWRRISTALSPFLSQNFNYDTGPFDDIHEEHAGQARGCSRATTTSTTPTRSASATTSSTRAPTCRQSGSSSLGTSRQTNTHQLPDLRELELLDSREPQVGRRRVELGVRHT